MINLRIIISLISTLFICVNLYAQYDGGTVIYNQTSSTNLTSIQKNYVVEDFDGDFNADVIMVKHNEASNTNHLNWYKGDGNGNFSSQNNLLNVNDEHKENEIFYADMNGDGNKDIIFQNNDTGFTILICDGQGNVSTQLNNNVIINDPPKAADLKEVADLDGDGNIDVIVYYEIDWPQYGGPIGYCLIGYNNGTGIFSNYNYLDHDYSTVFYQVEATDIDGDGDLDIISSGIRYPYFWIEPLRAFVKLYKNTGIDNYVHAQVNLSLNTYFLLTEYTFFDNCQGGPHDAVCDRFDQFGILDYSVQNDAFTTLELYNSWFHGYYENAFIGGDNGIYSDIFHIQFGHQNADNNLDILSVNVPQGKLQWYLGDGNGGFGNTQLVNQNNQYSSIRPALRVADMDNDTDLDVFVLLNDETSSNLTVFKNLTLTPSCSPVLDLGNTSLTDGIYQAGTTTISGGNVISGNNVVLKAGNRVKLLSGFKAPMNSSLKVRISACN